MNQPLNEKQEFKFVGLVDRKIIQNDWLHLKDWLKSSKSKRVRAQCLLFLLFFFVLVGVPVVPLINSNFFDLGQFFTSLITIPLLLGILPIIPFFLTFVPLELWISEKESIKRFSTFSLRQNRLFIRSRMIIPFILTFLIDMIIVLVIVTLGAFYQIGRFVSETFGSSLTFFNSGLGLLAVSILILTIFSNLLLNYHVIRYGNFLPDSHPSIPKTGSPDELTKGLERFQKQDYYYRDNKGLWLNSFYYFVIVISYYPLLVSLFYPSFRLNEGVIWFWTYLWNGIFILLILLIWRKTPYLLKNLPQSNS